MDETCVTNRVEEKCLQILVRSLEGMEAHGRLNCAWEDYV
jgi:hypothetical protein